MNDLFADAGRGKRDAPKTAIVVCIRCRTQSFDPWTRDFRDWPLIDGQNASEHCRTCWFEMARHRSRPLGHPGGHL